MNTIDVINKIKWQMYMHLPGGGIYEKCKSRLQGKSDDIINYVYNGDYLDVSVLEMYLNGYYSLKDVDVYNFYKYLLESSKVTYTQINGVLYMEFAVGDKKIRIPDPNFSNKKELASYRYELLDLILPYLITDVNGFNKLSFNEGPYEYKGREVDVTLKEGATVLDLGANFGMFSSLAATKGCNVYSFEPLTDAVYRFLYNLSLIYPNIHVVNEAVSNKVGEAYLNVNKDNYGGSYITNEFNRTNPLRITTVDKFVSENNINSVDFIKADIEGSECEMLEGARQTLKYFHPDLAICKYHKLNDDKMIRKLVLSANPNYKIESKWKKIYAQNK